MSKKRIENRLFRYTSLPIALDILSKQAITLLSPSSWDDRNDSYYLELYRSKMKLKTLLALCFTRSSETYHHWKVFSDGIGGVCIQFNKRELLESLEPNEGIEFGEVTYPRIRDLQNMPPDLKSLPYLKRWPYKDEKEFRIIYADSDHESEALSVPFAIDSIQKITLSPWIPETVSKTVKDVIKGLPGCSKLRVSRTTLVENKVWKNIATKEHG